MNTPPERAKPAAADPAPATPAAATPAPRYLQPANPAQARPANPVLVVGETLIDIVPQAGSHEEYLGGSPANIAIGLARLGVPVSLLTWIGDDARGRRAADEFGAAGVDLLDASNGPDPTATATASLDETGSASYTFDMVWRVPEVDLNPPRLLHVGSIGLFREPGGSRVLELLGAYHGRSIITIDPNIRPTTIPAQPVALERFEAAASLATLVKLSDEDAAWLYPALTLDEARDRITGLGPRSCVITRGAQGVLAQHDGEVFEQDPYPVTVVDTISAGDSFMASLIAGLLMRDAPPSAREFALVLDLAARAAALAVSKAGAAPPTAEELHRLPSRLGDPTP